MTHLDSLHEAMAIQRMEHVGIMVDDLAAAIEFAADPGRLTDDSN